MVSFRERKNYIKYMLSPVRNHFSFDEFLHYRMQTMDAVQQKEIMLPAELWGVEAKLNHKDYRELFNDKKKFYESFREFMHRDIYFLRENAKDEFRKFLEKHDKVVLKPAHMYAGLGIGIAVRNLAEIGANPGGNAKRASESVHWAERGKKESEADALRAYANKASGIVITGREGKKESEITTPGLGAKKEDAYRHLSEEEKRFKFLLPDYCTYDYLMERFDLLVENHYLAEEYVEQHSAFAKIYSNSLNTVRLTTFLHRNQTAEVFAAAAQFGSRGSITDNDDINGIWANIDLVTGNTNAVEINEYTGEIYEIHPDSGKEILGFAPPKFEEMKTLVCRAATKIPQCRLIGWDVCLTKDDTIELIEGNVTPELDLFQVMTGKGFRSFFHSEICE